MTVPRMRLVLVSACAALLLAMLGFLLFRIVEDGLSSSPNRDDTKPITLARGDFEGEIEGVRITKTLTKAESSCPDGFIAPAPAALADGTVWEIKPAYLPPGYTEVIREAGSDWAPVRICNGEIAGSFAEFSSNFGVIDISKSRSRTLPLVTDAEKISTGSVKGRTAILISPTPAPETYKDDPAAPSVLGRAYVIIPEDFGVTVITTTNLPLEEAIKVAEGLSR